jgi:lipopolysaccharide biosynthesis glycosyltransferase
VLFLRNIDEIFTLRPAYLAMARELTAPFFHQHETLEYVWRGKNYTVPMPFPIWTYNSGTVLFNLEKLRRHGYIYSFLAFCEQNAERIGNLDQSLLNYFFGKRITKLPEKWNYAPYRGLTMEKASIVHLHGPKPWNGRLDWFASLRINDYDAVCAYWKSWLNEEEASLVAGWESSGR